MKCLKWSKFSGVYSISQILLQALLVWFLLTSMETVYISCSTSANNQEKFMTENEN